MSPSAGEPGSKVRSNSLTFGAHHHQHQQHQHAQHQQYQQHQQQLQQQRVHHHGGHSVHAQYAHFGQQQQQLPLQQQQQSGVCSQSQEDQAVIDELVRRLPDGSGMRELQDWLKSLRLHKYTRLLLEFTFEELINLTEDQLEQKSVTQGARGKILKEISLVRERRERLEGMRSAVGDLNDLTRLERMLPELEKIILMPLKPYQPGPLGAASSSASAVANPEQGENIPEMIFDVLKKIYSSIFLCVNDNFNHGVLTVYVCLLQRCQNKEAFTHQQQQSFDAWIRRLRSVWNPPSIRKATDYKRKTSRDLSLPSSSSGLLRRLSLNTGHPCVAPPPPSNLGMPGSGRIAPPPPPPPGLGGTFPRGPSPQQQQLMKGNQSPEAMCNTMHRQMMASTAGLQRRSVPEIQPLPTFGGGMYPPIKRNSYQGDHRMVPLIDSEVLSNLMDCTALGATPHSSISSGSSSRRESTLSTDSGYHLSLPPSRRDSQMSAGSSRRDSEDSREFYLSSMDEGRASLGGTIIHPRRRDSAMSNDSGHGPYLSVESARRCSAGQATAAPSAAPAPPPPTGATLAPPPTAGAAGSVSSGCASMEGSTDSLVEQDLRNLSLSVTEQLWNE